jgi:hypothetical protein
MFKLAIDVVNSKLIEKIKQSFWLFFTTYFYFATLLQTLLIFNE